MTLSALATFGRWLLRWVTGGALDRALDLVEQRVESETEKERIKAGVIEAHLTSRAAFMREGGFWLMLIFSAPLALWWAAVLVYSVFWCADCAFPQDWTIAALPPPLDEWAGGIIVAIFGVVGVTRFRNR